VSVGFDGADQDFIVTRCDCPSWERDQHCCKHVLGLLLYIASHKADITEVEGGGADACNGSGTPTGQGRAQQQRQHASQDQGACTAPPSPAPPAANIQAPARHGKRRLPAAVAAAIKEPEDSGTHAKKARIVGHAAAATEKHRLKTEDSYAGDGEAAVATKTAAAGHVAAKKPAAARRAKQADRTAAPDAQSWGYMNGLVAASRQGWSEEGLPGSAVTSAAPFAEVTGGDNWFVDLCDTEDDNGAVAAALTAAERGGGQRATQLSPVSMAAIAADRAAPAPPVVKRKMGVHMHLRTVAHGTDGLNGRSSSKEALVGLPERGRSEHRLSDLSDAQLLHSCRIALAAFNKADADVACAAAKQGTAASEPIAVTNGVPAQAVAGCVTGAAPQELQEHDGDGGRAAAESVIVQLAPMRRFIPSSGAGIGSSQPDTGQELHHSHQQFPDCAGGGSANPSSCQGGSQAALYSDETGSAAAAVAAAVPSCGTKGRPGPTAAAVPAAAPRLARKSMLQRLHEKMQAEERERLAASGRAAGTS
jgi:hypothetical protein